MEIKDLLIADLEHFGEAFLRNEEVGEKRFEFFVTLSTAVIGGLVALATSSESLARTLTPEVTRWGLSGVLLFGLLTYVRLLQRNAVTDEYKKTLKFIRNVYKSASDERLPTYSVPLRPDPTWRSRWLRAGYAETIGVINGLLTAGVLVVWLRPLPWETAPNMPVVLLASSLGTATAMLLWAVAADRVLPKTKRPSVYFRAGVGAIVLSREGLALAIERRDAPGAWQYPQGGIEVGESAQLAVLREIEEEVGIAEGDLELVAEHRGPLAYHLPAEKQNAKTGLGQAQFWFLFRCRRPVTPTLGKEARASAWMSVRAITERAVEFRKPVYERLSEFARARGAL